MEAWESGRVRPSPQLLVFSFEIFDPCQALKAKVLKVPQISFKRLQPTDESAPPSRVPTVAWDLPGRHATRHRFARHLSRTVPSLKLLVCLGPRGLEKVGSRLGA